MKEYGRIINAISKNLICTTEQNEQNRVKQRALIQYFKKVQEFEVEETDPLRLIIKHASLPSATLGMQVRSRHQQLSMGIERFCESINIVTSLTFNNIQDT